MSSKHSHATWRLLWPAMLLIGLALLGYMVIVEGEPGALPLGLVLAGAIGTVATRRR